MTMSRSRSRFTKFHQRPSLSSREPWPLLPSHHSQPSYPYPDQSIARSSSFHIPTSAHKVDDASAVVLCRPLQFFRAARLIIPFFRHVKPQPQFHRRARDRARCIFRRHVHGVSVVEVPLYTASLATTASRVYRRNQKRCFPLIRVALSRCPHRLLCSPEGAACQLVLSTVEF